MIAILSDIHGNLPALEAVLADMPPVSRVWVLGDTVGEMPWPGPVLDRLASLPVPIDSVAGNREISLMEAGRGEHPDWWTGTQMCTLAWTADRLQVRHWEALRALPECLALDYVPGGALLCHGTPGAVRGQVYTLAQAQQAARGLPQRWLACGHIHKARWFPVGSRAVVNAGSVGLSLDGVGGTACYALLDETRVPGDGQTVVFRHVAYDVERTVRGLRRSGLPERAPGISRADILELRTGRHHVMSLLAFCEQYAERSLGYTTQEIPSELWREAEARWDGTEWLPGRAL